jgi:hypothetical protein
VPEDYQSRQGDDKVPRDTYIGDRNTQSARRVSWASTIAALSSGLAALIAAIYYVKISPLVWGLILGIGLGGLGLGIGTRIALSRLTKSRRDLERLRSTLDKQTRDGGS